ncbi:MAG: hypothetical protein ABIQ04_04955 [Candidatus Saccharimonadales bacterium]
MNPKLIVEQKITAFVNRYAIYATSPDGNKSQLIAFAQQKRLNFKEKVLFYSDESKDTPIFSFRAEKVFDIHGRYFVEDNSGALVGSFKKDFGKSFVSSTWHILDTSDNIKFTISESNKALAVFRRYGGYIPIVGDIIDLITLFFRYHFVFTQTDSGVEVGKYQKTTLFRDHYALSMTDAAYIAEDWRVLAAMSVALDALQSR